MAKLSAVAAVTTAVDVLSATVVSNISSLPAVVGIPSGNIPSGNAVLVSLLLASPDVQVVSCTAFSSFCLHTGSSSFCGQPPWSPCCGVPTVVSNPSSTDVSNSFGISAIVASPAVPVVSSVAVGPAVDVFYRCYFGPGVPAMA